MRLLALLLVLAASPARAELTLEEAIAAARARNERAAIAGETRAVARARVGLARAAFLPSVTLTGTYTRRAEESVRTVEGSEVTIQSQNALAATAALELNLFDARSIPLYRQAQRLDEAARASAGNDLRLLSFETAGAYLQALGNEQVVAAARRRVEHARLVLDLARARFEAQIARSSDVTRAELEEATALQALTTADAALADAYLALGFAIDARVTGPLVEPAALLSFTAAPPAPDRAGARRRRLDVTAGRRQAAALRESAREPLMRYVPSLGLSGQARATNEAGFTGRAIDWSISVVLTWRVFDGGQGLAERRERRASAAIAELQTDSLERQVDLQVARAMVAIESGRQGVAQSEAALAAARKNVQEVTELYRQGLTGALDVADSGIRLFEAEVAAIRARYTAALALLDLRAALGLDALGGEP
jgi:outer membrane protein TolC